MNESYYKVNSALDVVSEDNYSLLDPSVEIWEGYFPFKEGDSFPTSKIKERADVYKTNNYLYQNKIEEVLGSFFLDIPMIDLLNQMQIQQIVTGLPDFKNATDSWVTLMAAKAPGVEVIRDDSEINISDIESWLKVAGFTKAIKHVIKSNILCGNAVLRVDLDAKQDVVFRPIKCGCWQPYVFKDDPQDIQVNLIFNQYNKDDKSYMEFICFYFDGKIERHTFEYFGGVLGREIEDLKYSGKAFENLDISPIVVFSHNAVDGNIVGYDEYRYWQASILATIKCLTSILRVSDRANEYVKLVPKDALSFDSDSGVTVDINKGAIGYENVEKIPKIEYITPDISNVNLLMELYDRLVQRVSIDTKLGLAFYDSEKLGSNLSAKAIEASMHPARNKATSIISELEPDVKKLVIICAAANGLQVKESDISVTFYDGFPTDTAELTNTIQSRLNSTISTVDAIKKLDGVTTDVARDKAAEILKNDALKNTYGEKDNIGSKKDINNIKLESGDALGVSSNKSSNDDAVPGNPVLDSILG